MPITRDVDAPSCACSLLPDSPLVLGGDALDDLGNLEVDCQHVPHELSHHVVLVVLVVSLDQLRRHHDLLLRVSLGLNFSRKLLVVSFVLLSLLSLVDSEFFLSLFLD